MSTLVSSGVNENSSSFAPLRIGSWEEVLLCWGNSFLFLLSKMFLNGVLLNNYYKVSVMWHE